MSKFAINKSYEVPSGVISGFTERFEHEKYNPKVLSPDKRKLVNQSTKIETSHTFDDKPCMTQTGMNAHRIQQKREYENQKNQKWEDQHPYFIDKVLPNRSKAQKRPRPQTVKQKAVKRKEYLRNFNGLNPKTQEDDIEKCGDVYKIPLTCK
jgi:hypothetical protein